MLLPVFLVSGRSSTMAPAMWMDERSVIASARDQPAFAQARSTFSWGPGSRR